MGLFGRHSSLSVMLGYFSNRMHLCIFCVESLEKHYKLCRISQSQQVLIEHALFAKHWTWGSCQTKPLSSQRVSPAMQTDIKQMVTCMMSARTKTHQGLQQPGSGSPEFSVCSLCSHPIPSDMTIHKAVFWARTSI